MGYTHSWNLKSNHKRTGVKKLQTEVQKVLTKFKDILQYEYDVKRPALCELRDGGREIFIRFNGIDNDGHETFYFDSQDPDGNFCKTNRKEYDEPVTKVLMLLKGFYGQRLDLRSNGFHGYKPKDRYLGVGDIPTNKDLDGNWGWVWNWYNDIQPFGKPMRFRVIETHGGKNGQQDPYFNVTLYNG
jgi:hypothetical protein